MEWHWILLLVIIGIGLYFIYKKYILKIPVEALPPPSSSSPQLTQVDITNVNSIQRHLDEQAAAKITAEIEEANKTVKWNQSGLIQFKLSSNGQSCKFVIQLFMKDAPYSALNFITLCGLNPQMRTPYKYVGTHLHFWNETCIQMGDVLDRGGRTIYSIYETPYPAENRIAMNQEGLVAMIAAADDRNGCQFMIMTSPAQWLSGKYNIVGIIVDGYTNLINFGKDRDPTSIVIESIENYQEL